MFAPRREETTRTIHTRASQKARAIASPLHIAGLSGLSLAPISDYFKHTTEVQCAIPDGSGMADATQRILRCEAQRGLSPESLRKYLSQRKFSHCDRIGVRGYEQNLGPPAGH
jgi:hypothetical protein